MCDLGIRVGGERSAGRTYGAATLLVRHVKFDPLLRLVFLGKDSIPYDSSVACPDWRPSLALTKCVRAACRGKRREDRVFDLITPASVNKFLAGLEPGLTCKVIRTIRANQVFARSLSSEPKQIKDMAAAKRALRHALDAAASFCNHRTGADFGRLSRATTLGNYIDPLLVVALAARVVGPRARNDDDLLKRAQTLFPKSIWARYGGWVEEEVLARRHRNDDARGMQLERYIRAWGQHV